MVISGKGVTTYLVLSTKRTNNKQKATTDITDITNQDFSNFLRKFEIFALSMLQEETVS